MEPDLKTYVAARRTEVDEALRKVFPRGDDYTSEIVNAMEYSLFAGGKRLRPILCLAAAEAAGGTPSHAMPVACALELIHTYSLIHDDLPLMDNDDLRRGKPTNHKVYGEALALLAGDGLLTEAFRIMASCPAEGPVTAPLLLRVIALVSQAAGWGGMVGGQAVDMRWQGKKTDLETVHFIHRSKTAALIQVSVVSGALLGGASEPQVESMILYGEKAGLAFQISDDILDLESDSETLGKQVGSDVKLGKATYPAVAGVESSKKIQSNLINEALAALKTFDRRADPLRAIARYVIERKQ